MRQQSIDAARTYANDVVCLTPKGVDIDIASTANVVGASGLSDLGLKSFNHGERPCLYSQMHHRNPPTGPDSA